METVKTELWEVEERASNSWEIKGHGLEKCDLILRSSRYTAGKYTAEKEIAELIVTAVNACKAINPDNPINAASELTKIFEKLYELRDMIAIRDGNATLKTSAKFIEEMDSLFTKALN